MKSIPAKKICSFFKSLAISLEIFLSIFVKLVVIGLAPLNHSEYAASVIKPYVSKKTHWIIEKHGEFQMYYYAHHLGKNKNQRDKYKNHEFYDDAVKFCEKWDQASFDPNYKSMKNLTDQQKGSLLAFVAVMFITPDSLFIRLSNVDTWGLVFYRGIIPFFTVLLGMLIIYKLNFFKMLFSSGYHGIIYISTFSVTNITFVVSIQNTNVANTLVMIATAPMLSAILGAIFLKEPPDKKTWISIIITFFAVIYIFFDSLRLGNFYGDILGFITAIGLAVGAVTIRSAKRFSTRFCCCNVYYTRLIVY